jgi:hypothetical protein
MHECRLGFALDVHRELEVEMRGGMRRCRHVGMLLHGGFRVTSMPLLVVFHDVNDTHVQTTAHAPLPLTTLLYRTLQSDLLRNVISWAPLLR